MSADDDNRVQFLKELLLSSPPGQFDSVLDDVQKILIESGIQPVGHATSMLRQ